MYSSCFVVEKLETRVRSFGRRNPRNIKAKQDYFDPEDWKRWLEHLKIFYRNSIVEVAPAFANINDNRPHIHVKVFDEVFIALLDSGSNSSIIGRRALYLLEKFNLQTTDSKVTRLVTADGTTQEVLGTVEVPLVVGDTVKLIDFLVVPSLTHGIILGSDFCEYFDISVDFKTRIWRSGYSNLEAIKATNARNSTSTECNAVNVIHSHSDLSLEQKKTIDVLIENFKILSPKRLGRTTRIEHRIDTGDCEPIKQRHHVMSPYMLEHMNKELDKMIDLGVVRPSTSPWASPVLLVKKANGDMRFCFDGRKLNAVTRKCAYPLPLVDHILNKLSGAQFLSSIDLKSAFWQIPLEASSCEKTAFVVPGRGLFEFVVMPFGLCNAAQTQQKLMDHILGPDLDPYIFVYLDDVIIATPTFDQHVECLRIVFDRLRRANLTINIDKCEFCLPALKYLGFVVDRKGLRTNPEKVEAMLKYPIPQSYTEVKRFLGLCSWYRRFVKNFSTVVAPLNGLLKGRKKNQKIEWTEEASTAFQSIKEALVSAPILASPDFSKPFVIQADASGVGLGAVLTQMVDEKECVVAYASRTLTQSERKYTVTEKELLAVVFALEKFRCYVEGQHFTVITDHASLRWLNNLKDPVGRLARWAIKLQQFDMEVVHRKGSLNIVPDALSRAPVETCLLDFSSSDFASDQWYSKMLKNVSEEPQKYADWMIDGEKLYKHLPDDLSFRTNNPVWKLVVPKSLRKDVLKECHDNPLASHGGVFKTTSRLKELYYWPQLTQDVKRYVRNCNICAQQKAPNYSRPGLMGQPKRANFPWQYISVDILGPLPRSKSGCCYLLVVSDYFSKYCLLHPMKKATTSTIAKFIENQVFLVFGAPQIVMTDNGSQFVSKDFKSLCEEYGARIWYNARYHAQVNAVERVNRVIGAAIRSYIKEDHRDWDAKIHKIAFAMRTAVHQSTGHSPAFLNFGRYLPCKGTFYGRESAEEELLDITNREHFVKNLEQLPELFKDVRRHLARAYEQNVKTYNLRKRPAERYCVGDFVWKKNYVLSSAVDRFAAKLAPKYVLCTVERVVSPLTYHLRSEEGADVGIWHVKDLKPYHESDPSNQD